MPPSGDHRAWSEFWGRQAINSIILASDDARDPMFRELDLRHAVRATRLAWYHACRLKNYRYWDVMWTRKEQ